MADVIAEYTPPATYWEVEQELTLTPGTWASLPSKFWSEAEADAEALRQSRANNTTFRVTETTATVTTVRNAYSSPTAWWIVESYTNGSWAQASPEEGNAAGRFWSEAEAQGFAQELTRSTSAPSRVVSYPPA